MKKEQWLYVVIAILAIWIIASYVSAPKSSTVPEGNNYGTNGTEQTNPVSAIPSSSETQQASVINAGVNINAQVGNEAGPNKGILTASVASNNKVIVSDQLAGNMVKIESVSLTFDGWVAVHEDINGQPGNILGAQRFDAGSYSGGQVELARASVTGGKYYVMLHTDDGDKMFDHKLDLPFMENGLAVMITFIAQ